MLEDLYLEQEKSLEEIAKILGCTRPMVQILMEKHNIPRRNRSNARTLAIKNNKFKQFEYDTINEAFFSVWTPAMAWLLGLLFTDGYIMETGSGLRVILASVDIEMLEKVRALLGSNRAIKKKVQSYDKTKHIYTFEFFREKMRTDLIYLGLNQRKSLNMLFPDVPEPFVRHFIRGCWDGDGSVYIDKKNKLNASFVTGSYEFMKKLVLELSNVGITKQTADQLLSIHKEKRSNAYSIKLNSRKNLERLFHFFYEGVDECMFLRRKYDIFVQGLNISETMQTTLRAVTYKTISIPIRHETETVAPGNNDTNNKSRSIDEVIKRITDTKNKKILKIKNNKGRMRCDRCGSASDILYMVNKVYCQECFLKTFKA